MSCAAYLFLVLIAESSPLSSLYSPVMLEQTKLVAQLHAWTVHTQPQKRIVHV